MSGGKVDAGYLVQWMARQLLNSSRFDTTTACQRCGQRLDRSLSPMGDRADIPARALAVEVVLSCSCGDLIAELHYRPTPPHEQRLGVFDPMHGHVNTFGSEEWPE